ncbi:MAG: hypothetical protein J7480_00535 [Microbacteriaceae bacterium]|nr:hypothetical protein [Microbacteriaceae bacterium]
MSPQDAVPVGDAEGRAVPGERPVEQNAPERPPTSVPTPILPTRRDRTRPLELLGLSAALAAFAGVVAAIVLHPWGEFAEQAAQSWLLVLIVSGAAFVLSLVTLAMLSLGGYEPPKQPPAGGVLGDDSSPH